MSGLAMKWLGNACWIIKCLTEGAALARRVGTLCPVVGCVLPDDAGPRAAVSVQ